MVTNKGLSKRKLLGSEVSEETGIVIGVRI